MGGLEKEVVLPVLGDDEEERRDRERGVRACERGRMKVVGLERVLRGSEGFTSEQGSGKRGSGIATVGAKVKRKVQRRFLECKVVPEQPLLRIRRTSLTHGALMLYNGETSVSSLLCLSSSSFVSYIPSDAEQDNHLPNPRKHIHPAY